MSITALPTPPQRSDPTNFPTRADAFMSALPTFGTEANALQVDVNAKQLAAAQSVVDAAAQVTLAENQVALATIQANNAAASASAAASGAGVAAWVSGTTYTVGTVVYSPIDFRSYRRTNSGAGAVDPSSDTTNWFLVSQFTPQKLYVRDEKPAGTSGGSSTAGTVQRTLNTVVVNTISGASLSSNNVTLPRGTYDFYIKVPAYTTSSSQAALINITDTLTFVGSSESPGGSAAATVSSIVQGQFTISSSKIFRVDHYNQVAVGAGLGMPVGSPFNKEVYTEAIFTKIS